MRQILTRAAPVALICDPAMEEQEGDSAAPIATIAYTASRFSPSLARCSGLYNYGAQAVRGHQKEGSSMTAAHEGKVAPIAGAASGIGRATAPLQGKGARRGHGR